MINWKFSVPFITLRSESESVRNLPSCMFPSPIVGFSFVNPVLLTSVLITSWPQPQQTLTTCPSLLFQRPVFLPLFSSPLTGRWCPISYAPVYSPTANQYLSDPPDITSNITLVPHYCLVQHFPSAKSQTLSAFPWIYSDSKSPSNLTGRFSTGIWRQLLSLLEHSSVSQVLFFLVSSLSL